MKSDWLRYDQLTRRNPDKQDPRMSHRSQSTKWRLLYRRSSYKGMSRQRRICQPPNQWRPVKVKPVLDKSLERKTNNGNRKGAEKKNQCNRSIQEWTNRSSNRLDQKPIGRQAQSSKQERHQLILSSKVCWTYWTKNEAVLWVRSTRHFPMGVPGQVEKGNQICIY